MNPSARHLLSRSRELTSRSREVYKEKKKEIQKDPSREIHEDVNREKVSARPAFEPEAVASTSVAFVSDKVSLESETSSPRSQGAEEGIVISPREHSISRYSGISVQHVRTAKGVKIAVTLQQPDWAESGECQMATAELKRYDRMREERVLDQDSEQFAAYVESTKLELTDKKSRSACVGRLHHRGQRSAWLLDALCVAVMQDHKIVTVMLYLEGEEFLIDLTLEMSPNQQKFYHATGIHGALVSARKSPRLADLPRVKFGEIQ